MRAIQYLGTGHVARTDVPMPVTTPGRVLIRVAAAGICHTDVHFRASPQPAIPPGTVLGHEIAGTIVELGDGVTSFAVGDQVIVHPVWSCGTCRQCVAGLTNACLSTAGRLSQPPVPGVSVNGGIADFVAVPATALVAADGLDPAFAATLTDAGLVPYHSINAVRGLLRPGSCAVVIGIGGLGQFAIEILRASTVAQAIALDVREQALDEVRSKVDHTFLSTDDDIEEKVLRAAGGHGADFVLDLVGTTTTLALAGAVVAPYGTIRVPGQGDGTFQFETGRTSTTLPRGATISRPFSGTQQDLVDLVGLARTRRLTTRITRYGFEDALAAFDDLESGRLFGRAVIVMD
ncbi:alcohol dehydrogenase catalytic domain-containing protein [Saccharopolyspora pogona]|uniref:alcohol dehydrogenase catalytic domain-containing protein n=1 Tax=Saccharopolyspora pogona TaxID=333966 RepID=UPI001682D0BC|nr:alcohol dehydrogenase catalytic domain-containing protein [Saccharopolyspora pogona]